MKRNLIVLCGVIVVIISMLFLPVITYTQKFLGVGPYQITLKESSGIVFAIMILFIMLLKWRWRGTIWIVLSIVGAIWTPTTALRFYTIGKNMMEGDVRYPADFRGPPSFNVGLYLIIAGYVIVVAGSIWDIVQKGNKYRINLLLLCQLKRK
jgi:hypothetical protein